MLPRTHSPLALDDSLQTMDANDCGEAISPSSPICMPISWEAVGNEAAPLVIDVPPFCVEETETGRRPVWSRGKVQKWWAALVLLCVVAAGGSIGFVSLVRHVSSSNSSDPGFEESSWPATVSTSGKTAEPADRFSAKEDYYRTAFHFQPAKNWMNDPNGPLYYKGYYHLFYQYNPHDVVWGNIVWGHAVSTDLIHWRILDAALVPDKWYDIKGVWSGSATFLKDGTPVLMYTGDSSVGQLQNKAVPADPTDPLLLKWEKVAENPLILTPPGTNATYFRDPTTGWMGDDGKWRILVGSASFDPPDPKNKTGLALLYTSSDFLTWAEAGNPLHSVERTGMWECPDFYPVPVSGNGGLDTSVNGPSVKHVLKVSLDITRHDYYTVGTYEGGNDTFVPVLDAIDAGLGLRYDYGKFYASKTFFDQNKQRRILWGWANESDSVPDDYRKGWSSVQAIPRKIWLDNNTGTHLIQWPVQEIEAFRQNSVSKNNFTLKAGGLEKIGKLRGPQLDIEVVFDIPEVTRANNLFVPTDVLALEAQQLCGQGSGAGTILGPFGVLVLAAHALQEYTAVFFSLVQTVDGTLKVLVCSDQSRSSLAADLDKTVYGSFLRTEASEMQLSLRILVDHSIVETFAQGGKVSVTSRVYPTLALEDKARVYLFNNGSTPIRVLQFNGWQLNV